MELRGGHFRSEQRLRVHDEGETVLRRKRRTPFLLALLAGGADLCAGWAPTAPGYCATLRNMVMMVDRGDPGRLQDAARLKSRLNEDSRFKWPTPATTPNAVLVAQLNASKAGNLADVYHLMSRARKLAIEEAVARDVRENNIAPERTHSKLAEFLRLGCPGLLQHQSSRIVGSLGDPEPPKGLLPKWMFRVRIEDSSQHFIFILTRQSDYDGGDARDKDGFERCWFVWSIKPDRGGGSNADVRTPTPDREPALV